jgi:hypothetical protein
MLFPIMLFLMVLSPLFIPVLVTVVHEFGNLRNKPAARPAFAPAFAGAVPAAA